MGNPTEPKSEHCSSLMDRVLERNNLACAFKQVCRNHGAPGIDGMTVDEFSDFLKKHWLMIRTRLEDGSYRPHPVKRVEIPKPDGSKRKLGIPTVLDRFIQQAVAQIVQQDCDGGFHDNSYGFRPNRNAHQAIRYSQETLQAGYSWVVDCDLEAFFDCVNHDLLMSLLKVKFPEPSFLRLINRFLKAGIFVDGNKLASTEGVPQGGPLSPVLSNILLNQLDWELDKRGHRFVRYADDFVVFVKSREAGKRVMLNLQRFVGSSLRLNVNARKSAVDRPWNRTFLGFTFTRGRGFRIKVAAKALYKLKVKIRLLTRRTRGYSITRIIAELKKSLNWASPLFQKHTSA